MKYRKEIDGLRALAVLPVMLFHAGFQVFSGGYIGVDVFFVISGYLITSIIVAELDRGSFSIAGFYERRARRILPALFFVLAVTLPFALAWLLPREMKDYARSLIAVPLFLSNVLFYRESGYFDTGVDTKPLIHTWSLAVEEQFYILFPLVLMLVWRFGKKKAALPLLLIGAASLAAAQIFVKTRPDATFYLLHARAWELMIGALTALYLKHQDGNALAKPFASLFSLAGLLMVGASIFIYSASTPFPSVYALLPTVGAALIIAFAGADNLAGRLLGWRPLVAIGLISYSAYLWHQPLFVFARIGFGAKNGSSIFLALLLATLALAYLSWRFIEQPFRDKVRFKRRAIFASSLACSILLLAVGQIGNRTGGGFFRYDPEAMTVMGHTEERGKYVWHNADRINLQDFAPGKRKILVIGDSMGADMVNTVFESPYADRVSMSFHTIDFACGNLYLKESFNDKVDPGSLQACQNRGWYANPKLKPLLKEADQVWLVSVWVPWQVERLNESLANLKSEFGDKFIVVSRKSFGKVPLDKLSKLNLAERRAYRMAPDAYAMLINKQLIAQIPADHYFDISQMICKAESCPYFDKRGELLSFDGDHLTAAGARFMSQHLMDNPRFVHQMLGVP